MEELEVFNTRVPEGNFTDVGIVTGNNEHSLWLPHGYQKVHKAEESKSIAFEIYRMLFRFADICRYNDRKLVLPEQSRTEGSITKANGLSYQSRPDAKQPIFSFRLISTLRNLFSLLRTPTILNLMPHTSPSHGHFDWRQIERQLGRAMFLKDGTPVFEAMDASRPVLRDQTADIIGMACWVARDAADHFLGVKLRSIAGSGLAMEWQTLADDFSERYLGRTQSFFSDSSGKTCRELQYILFEIDRLTPLKSPRYIKISDLLEAILSFHVCGDGGDLWAIEGFSAAWESICLDHAIDTLGQEGYEIFTCDDSYLDPQVTTETLISTWRRNQAEVFSRNARDRRPDLVVKRGADDWKIIDFKYYSVNTIPPKGASSRPSHKDSNFDKHAQDLDNLEAYGFLLATARKQSVPLENITYEIWTPGVETIIQDWELVSTKNQSQWRITVKQVNTQNLVKAYGDKFRMWW